MRPVYEVLGFYNILYLSYDGQYWQISDGWVEEDIHRHVVFRVQDTALRPEYITSTWQINNNKTFEFLSTLKLRCSGFMASPDGACDTNMPCKNQAQCQYVSHTPASGEIMCRCKSANQGTACKEVLPSCPLPSTLELPHNGLLFSQNGHRLGDVMTYFCSESAEKHFFFAKCQIDRSGNETKVHWVHYGNCRMPGNGAPLTNLSILLMTILATWSSTWV